MKKTREDPAASHQEAMTEVRRLVEEAKELSGTAEGGLTDHLATWIAGRYAIAVRQLAVETGSGQVDWNLLRGVCHDVGELRRGDHSAESLRIERERWEAEKVDKKLDLDKQFWEWAKENQEKICTGFVTQAQKIEKLAEAMFGENWDDKSPPAPSNGNDGPVCPAPIPPANKGE